MWFDESITKSNHVIVSVETVSKDNDNLAAEMRADVCEEDACERTGGTRDALLAFTVTLTPLSGRMTLHLRRRVAVYCITFQTPNSIHASHVKTRTHILTIASSASLLKQPESSLSPRDVYPYLPVAPNARDNFRGLDLLKD